MYEYAHVSLISFSLLMNQEPLIFHRQRINAGRERGAKPPGRQLQPSCRRSQVSPWQRRRTTGRSSGWASLPLGCWAPAASAQWVCNWCGWCESVPSSNEAVCFGLVTLLGSAMLMEKEESRAQLHFYQGGWLQRCRGCCLGDPPSLWTHGGLLYTCIFLDCPPK